MKKRSRASGCILSSFLALVSTAISLAQTPAGEQGMVSSAHPLATQAGIEVLREGGNAFDAAVAVAAALNVVEPDMSGMGGYGTIIVYDARKGEARFLNPSGRIPSAVDSDAFRSPTPGYRENRRGAKAVSTPGNVHAWQILSKTYGSLEWERLLQPAIRLAEAGFAIDARLARSVDAAWPAFPEHARAFYGKAGRPLQPGGILLQRDLGRSLRLIAQGGAGVVHGGDLGKAIAAEMALRGGFLQLSDLEKHESEWWQPIRIRYRGYDVVTASAPANAFDYLVRLGMLSRFDAETLGHNTAAYLHRFAEITKHGFWVRLRFAGDPDVNPPPLEKLLSEAYWKQEAGKIDLERAGTFQPPQAAPEPGGHTTHFAVADQWGNVVSATQTLGNAFGARIMARGTGIWLNNSLAYCSFEPKGNPMDAHAGRRKLSGDCPTIILRDGLPWVAIGTPGGHTIGQTVPQMVANLIDFKMSISDAVSAGRISFEEPDTLLVEDRIPESLRKALADKGHKLRVVGAIGNAHGLSIEYDAARKPVRFEGAADPRGSGKAQGY